MSEESTTLECRQCGTNIAEPEAAKVVVVTEAPAGERGPVERRYLANDWVRTEDGGLLVLNTGDLDTREALAARYAEHAWLSARFDGASTGDPYFRQGKKLAIALDALRVIAASETEYGRAAQALYEIADEDL